MPIRLIALDPINKKMKMYTVNGFHSFFCCGLLDGEAGGVDRESRRRGFGINDLHNEGCAIRGAASLNEDASRRIRNALSRACRPGLNMVLSRQRGIT